MANQNTGLKLVTGKKKYATVSCVLKEHDDCLGWIIYPGESLPPLLANASPFFKKSTGQFAVPERSATITAAIRKNHDLKMMCRCGCHLEKLLAEQDRLSTLRGALEVGMPSEGD